MDLKTYLLQDLEVDDSGLVDYERLCDLLCGRSER
jgi:hypothetical protein